MLLNTIVTKLPLELGYVFGGNTPVYAKMEKRLIIRIGTSLYSFECLGVRIFQRAQINQKKLYIL